MNSHAPSTVCFACDEYPDYIYLPSSFFCRLIIVGANRIRPINVFVAIAFALFLFLGNIFVLNSIVLNLIWANSFGANRLFGRMLFGANRIRPYGEYNLSDCHLVGLFSI